MRNFMALKNFGLIETEVVLWNQTDYTFLKRQSKNHTGKWETITDGRVASVGAVPSN